jgi:GAF domain-containing protein
VNNVLQALVSSAVGATGAGAGWVLAARGDRLVVVGAVGAADLLDVEVPGDVGTAGYVVATGQPMALVPSGDDSRLGEGVLSLLPDRPTALLCVPCSAGDTIVGALELVDKAGGGPFSFDDVELATILAGVAAAAIESAGDTTPVRSPAEFAGELRRLEASDPAEYARVASLLESVLARA